MKPRASAPSPLHSSNQKKNQKAKESRIGRDERGTWEENTCKKRRKKNCKLTKSSQILNYPQTSLSVRNRRIEIVLFPVFIHTEALEVNIPSRTKLRFDGAWDVNWTLHIELLHAAFHDAELDCYDACHFDCAAEGYLAVALAGGKMNVSYKATCRLPWNEM